MGIAKDFRPNWLIGLILTMLSLGGFYFIKKTPSDSPILAQINSRRITVSEFKQIYIRNSQYFKTEVPEQEAVLEDLIKRELGVQEARKLGLENDLEVIEKVNTILYHALLNRRLTPEFEKIQISDELAQIYYEKNPEIRTSQIFVPVPPHASEEEQKAAYEKIKTIQEVYLFQKKMNFVEVAQRHSTGPTAAMGGDTDFQMKNRLDSNYYKAAVELKSPGQISPIIRSAFGYHIIRLTAVRPWDQVDKNQVKRMVLEEEKTRIFEEYMNSLKSKAKVRVDKALLNPGPI